MILNLPRSSPPLTFTLLIVIASLPYLQPRDAMVLQSLNTMPSAQRADAASASSCIGCVNESSCKDCERISIISPTLGLEIENLATRCNHFEREEHAFENLCIRVDARSTTPPVPNAICGHRRYIWYIYSWDRSHGTRRAQTNFTS